MIAGIKNNSRSSFEYLESDELLNVASMEKFRLKKLSFHVSLINLNLKNSCYKCASDTSYTRSIRVCSSCCHHLKDFTETRSTGEKFCFDVDKGLTELLENTVRLSQLFKEMIDRGND